jgi:hypothetical protein
VLLARAQVGHDRSAASPARGIVRAVRDGAVKAERYFL